MGARRKRIARGRKKKGVKQCLIDWAVGPPTEGFNFLAKQGLVELTAEYLVVKYEGRFPAGVVEAAKKRLLDAGAQGAVK